MTGLLDASHERSRGNTWSRRFGWALAMLAVVGLIVWAGMKLGHGPSGAKRQVARIALLPDTPPPPPPPPPEQPKIEPREQLRQQIDKPKAETPPEPQQLKMEGEAGEGPSPFASGEVKNDYIGGDTGNGARFAAYVGRIAQLVQEQLAKHNLRVASARVYLWLKSDGAVQRFQVDGANADLERQLRVAMADLDKVPEAPPQDMPMPMGLEISER